jgi:hypothetical protein
MTPASIESGGVAGRRRHGSSSLRRLSTPGAGAALVVELRKRRSPSMVPAETGHDTCLVLDDLGRLGRVWRETAEEDANHETLIRDLLDDQYTRPTRIIAFNTTEGWSRDVTLDIADELRRWFAEYDDVPVSVEELLEMPRR